MAQGIVLLRLKNVAIKNFAQVKIMEHHAMLLGKSTLLMVKLKFH